MNYRVDERYNTRQCPTFDLRLVDAMWHVVTKNATMAKAFMSASGSKNNISKAPRNVIQHMLFPYVGLS
ncbi:hypothetical protein DPMN_049721 [Dreissena polymorpha]|uniref:Uncharacterized protein n=1 Tax=Dreissena polymorpha TaxID=45954 RepID=A0A9D4CG35_DREPO|nr:hypothetical protein DPMN_049721 [Dreissena polymorpha]